MCSDIRYVDPMRFDELKKTIETINQLMQSDGIDPITRNQAEEAKRALEEELETLRPQNRF